MDIISELKAKAKKTPRRIVLPEGEDKRTIGAAAILVREGLAKPSILGSRSVIETRAKEAGVDLSGVDVIDPAADARLKDYGGQYHDLRKHKGVDAEQALKAVTDPMLFGTMMLHNDHVDGFLSGAAHSTADTIRPALQIIKPSPKIRTVSSFFIMIFKDKSLGDNGVLIMGDCAINIDPPPKKLANIAVSTARMAKVLCGLEPRVAMLSFSTGGSAEHELVDRVKEATRLAKEKAPDLLIDGEMQADAALVPEIGKRKFPGSAVAGRANVLIFPDLQSANIGYKLVQRLTGAEALGPVLQGFNKPVNDLSRGATVDDIVNLAAVTGLQADPALRG